mgnify:CR=1 FL=1
MFCLQHWADEVGFDLSGATVSIQGFGNVGSATGKILQVHGARLVAVADHAGAITDEDGIDAFELADWVREHGSVAGFPKAMWIDEEDFWSVPADLLVPAALENQITAANVGRIQARVVVEAANGPTTLEAEKILEQRGIEVLPDILVNAGGVIVSYFEWTQNLYQHQWERERVTEELEKIMTRAYQAVKETVERESLTYREAAFVIGIGRVAHVAKLRGFI